MKKVLPLIFSILVAQGAGLIGSIVTFPSIPSWYAALNKPSFNPPNWLFGPVWTILFVFMGISSYLVWQKGARKKLVKEALVIYGMQLVLNTLWSIIFFGLHQPTLAFMEIVILWLAILFTILRFHKVSPPAAYLLVPYILWVTFASFLNLAIVVLN